MLKIPTGLEEVLCLIDDVLVFGKSEEEHNRRLTVDLGRKATAGVTLNSNKCKLRKKKVKCLGHIIDKKGISTDPSKIVAITEMESPTNILEVRRFMRMVNQLGKFSQNIADLSQPL